MVESPAYGRQLFGIDLRSLALVRILLGVFLIFDAATRWTDFAAFYADSGLVSLQAARDLTPDPGAWSLYWCSASDGYQRALLIAQGGAGILLALGCWTRLSSVLSWVLIASLWNRNPLVNNYGDTLLRMLLFWGMFLPWGATWSVDWLRRVRLGQTALQPQVVQSVASAAILLQLALLYFFTGIWKWNPTWLEGRALADALNVEYFARPSARVLLAYPSLLRPLTQATLFLELAGPLALWIPWQTARIRLVVMGCFFALHIGIELVLSPVYLSYICLIAWLLFLPSSIWEGRWLSATLGHWEHALASRLAPEPLPERASPAALGGRCVIGQSPLTNAVCLFFLAYVVVWNVATLGPQYARILPGPFRYIGQAAMLWQTWDMYDVPSRHHGWFSAPTRLRNGQRVDALWTGRPVDRQHPQPYWDDVPNPRWRVFLFRLSAERYRRFHPPLATFLLARWNTTHQGETAARELELCYYHRLPDEAQDPHGFAMRVIATIRAETSDAESEESPLARLFQERELGNGALP
ncbi:MAG: HTTM domain-containing protein [Pirellulales bacterium]